MNEYIFLTFEWYTYQPESEASEPDIDNVQMIWISKWNSKEDAFENLKNDNEWLLETNFDEIYCHELRDHNFTYFYLKD